MPKNSLIKTQIGVDLTRPSFNPVSIANQEKIPDLYFGLEAPRQGVVRTVLASAIILTAGWAMGWRYGLPELKDRYFSDW